MNSTDLLPTSTSMPVASFSTTPAPILRGTPEPVVITAGFENSTSHIHFSDSTSPPEPEPLSFILVPVIVILVVALFSGLAIHCIQRRQRLDNLRHTLIPLYTYNRHDDDWGVLLDNGIYNRDLSRRGSRDT